MAAALPLLVIMEKGAEAAEALTGMEIYTNASSGIPQLIFVNHNYSYRRQMPSDSDVDVVRNRRQ